MNPSFHHVNYLWDDDAAQKMEGDELSLFLYRSNLLGADLRVTNYGGGNTSCKTIEQDPLTGENVEVMWVKGSGGDLGTLTRSGIAGLYTKRLRDLKNVYRGIEYEDEIVPLYRHCLFDLDSRAPSIDTALHGLLPFTHIDHLHPDAVIAIAAADGSKSITREIWGETMGWVPWQRPGFDLGIQLERCLEENPGIRGIILGGHGLFTWGDSSHSCYQNSLEVIERASEYIASKAGKGRPIFGGARMESLPSEVRKKQASKLAPILRGMCSGNLHMVGHYTDDPRVMEFINSHDLSALAPMGTSCPDHFLRTKIQPMILDLEANTDLSDSASVKNAIEPAFKAYREEYKAYYDGCKHPDSPKMRDPNPVVILCPGMGMFTFAKNKQTARVAAEFYLNAINVMRGSEAISSYMALPRQEAFDIEYWALEEAKLQRMPPEKPLSRKIALVTGAGGGIGRAIAEKLIQEGANVVLADIDEDRLTEAATGFSRDLASTVHCDVSSYQSIENAFEFASLAYGGVDIVVHSAGLAISKTIAETGPEDWDLLQDVLVKGQFLLFKSGTEVLRRQGLGGDLVSIASKNGLVAGPKNVGYGSAKAAQQHMTRLLASELGPEKIRVNTINPDGVIIGSKIWEGAWAEGRAKAYGITVEELPQFYARRNLMNEIIRPEDIANAVFALTALLDKTTGNMINVDGGMSSAFVR